MSISIFAYIWRYTIRPEREAEFLAAYTADGEWARFFGRDLAYIRTDLLRDADRPDVYLTVDYWKSRADRDRFKEENLAELDDIDKRCEDFTLSEEFLGDYLITQD